MLVGVTVWCYICFLKEFYIWYPFALQIYQQFLFLYRSQILGLFDIKIVAPQVALAKNGSTNRFSFL